MTNHTRVLGLAMVLAATLGGTAAAMQAPSGGPASPALDIPPAMKAEHEKIHNDLVAATQAGGQTGEAAKRVAAVLHPHFESEEEFALPPLALLHPLAEGGAKPDMRKVIALTDRLKSEMPRMLSEHRALLPVLDELERAARAEQKPEALKFAEELRTHAQTEEQVLYPAAILVGEYLKLRFPQ